MSFVGCAPWRYTQFLPIGVQGSWMQNHGFGIMVGAGGRVKRASGELKTPYSWTVPTQPKEGFLPFFHMLSSIRLAFTTRETRCGNPASSFSAGFPFSERHVQAAWYDPEFRPAHLITTTGEPLTVEQPGRWNLEAGPDFLGAVLRVGRETTPRRG